jgi:hypothetical protein
LTPLELYLLHWRDQLERWWRAYVSVVDMLAVSTLLALGAALLLRWA